MSAALEYAKLICQHGNPQAGRVRAFRDAMVAAEPAFARQSQAVAALYAGRNDRTTPDGGAWPS